MKTIKIGLEHKEVKDKDKQEFIITHSEEITSNEALSFALSMIHEQSAVSLRN